MPVDGLTLVWQHVRKLIASENQFSLTRVASSKWRRGKNRFPINNSRLKFALGPAEFINRWCMEGPTHHCALGVAHQMDLLRKVSKLLHIPLVEVC